jgi:hypothetical protein
MLLGSVMLNQAFWWLYHHLQAEVVHAQTRQVASVASVNGKYLHDQGWRGIKERKREIIL